MTEPEPPAASWPPKAPWDGAEESATQIRALNSEAFQFFGFTLACYSLQLAFAVGVAIGGIHRFPFIGALAFVVLNDGLTVVLAVAVMARYSLSSLIFEWWPPWVYTEVMIDRARLENKIKDHRLDVRFVRAWFHKERLVFGNRQPLSWVDRRLSEAKGSRMILGVVFVVLALALPGWWILSTTWGSGWPF